MKKILFLLLLILLFTSCGSNRNNDPFEIYEKIVIINAGARKGWNKYCT